MAATPKNGTMTFDGASGRSYTVSVYLSDVAAADITWSQDGAAVAGSPSYWIAPESVRLRDFSVVTGTVDTTVMKLLINGVSVGQILAYANHVNTIATRPNPSIPITAGREVRFRQA